MVQDRAVFLSP